MIRVRISIDADRRISGFHMAGHASYSEPGSDIVCAAASVLAQTTIEAMVEVLKLTRRQFRYRIDDRGVAECIAFSDRMNVEEAERLQIVYRVFETGILGIAREYGKYIEVKYKEV